MATVAAMRREIRRLREQIGMPDDPRHWVFLLLVDEELPGHIRTQIGERDTVVVKRIMNGFMDSELKQTGEFEPSIGYVMTLQGDVTCLYKSGKTLEVSRERTYRSRATRRRF